MIAKLDTLWQEFKADEALSTAIELAASELINMVTERMSWVFGWEVARSAWKVIAEECGAVFGQSDLLESLEGAELGKIRITQRVEDLYAYAYFGLPVRQSGYLNDIPEPQGYDLDPTTQRDAIDNLIEEFEIWGGQDGAAHNFSEIVKVAVARRAIDMSEGDGPVSVTGLAGLANISVKSLRNRISPSGGAVMRLRDDGTVAANEARTWLNTMKRFRPSLWPEMADEGAWHSPAQEEAGTIQDVVFVPVAQDGSFFSVKNERDGSYFVGTPGQERKIETYDAALTALTHMSAPQWRRQTPKGRWTSVRGISWERKTPSEIGLDKE